MTIVFWVNNGGALLCTEDGYGDAYGLYNNSGEMIIEWPCFGQPSGGGGWDTGLQVPTNGWTFVAYVVEPDRIIVYVGNNDGNLVSSSSYTALGAEDVETSDQEGDTAALYPPGLGRFEYPFDEDGGGNPWGTVDGTWSDVAIFFHSLSASSITNLYLSGVGQAVYATPDGLGNLNLNWNPAFTLQEAGFLTGPWTDVGGSPTPPDSVPISNATQHYYRVRK